MKIGSTSHKLVPTRDKMKTSSKELLHKKKW